MTFGINWLKKYQFAIIFNIEQDEKINMGANKLVTKKKIKNKIIDKP